MSSSAPSADDDVFDEFLSDRGHETEIVRWDRSITSSSVRSAVRYIPKEPHGVTSATGARPDDDGVARPVSGFLSA